MRIRWVNALQCFGMLILVSSCCYRLHVPKGIGFLVVAAFAFAFNAMVGEIFESDEQD